MLMHWMIVTTRRCIGRREAATSIRPFWKPCSRPGPVLTVRNEDGNTPLHRAADYRFFTPHFEVREHAGAAIEALLAAGADPMVRNVEGTTPWDRAQTNSALQGSDAFAVLSAVVTEALLAVGADLEARGPNGSTPLHWEAQYTDNPAAIEALVVALLWDDHRSTPPLSGRLPTSERRPPSSRRGPYALSPADDRLCHPTQGGWTDETGHHPMP